ncbi:AraC family transcriptional regulator [Paracoccus zhejiangensis]|uniref:AraC family transcriptional regulator n=1 Tax=Paracoccus zhejiangensis TaxID=1077935 RepID=UPI001E42917E|nr:AraC family transcriptional regulator [Paracoccus zhejiangensis]
MRAGSLVDFQTALRDAGGDFDASIRAFGLNPADMEVPDKFVRYSSVVLAIEAAARKLGVADLGLRISALQSPDSFGPLWLLMKSAPTVRDGILLGIKHASFYVPAQGYRHFRSADGKLECIEMFQRVLDLPAMPQTAENAAGQLHRFVLELSDHATRPAEIHFRHPQVGSDDQYRRHFGIVPQFDSDFDGIAVDPAGFRRRIPDQSPLLRQFIERFLSGVTPEEGHTTVHQVSALLHNLVRANMAELATVAALMGQHPRTLQRRLGAEGARFEDLRDAARKELARQLLAQRHLSLAQIGIMLGYADQPVLTRACRRWFGTTPLRLRRGTVHDTHP